MLLFLCQSRCAIVERHKYIQNLHVSFQIFLKALEVFSRILKTSGYALIHRPFQRKLKGSDLGAPPRHDEKNDSIHLIS